jgi:hypothetical protein
MELVKIGRAFNADICIPATLFYYGLLHGMENNEADKMPMPFNMEASDR